VSNGHMQRLRWVWALLTPALMAGFGNTSSSSAAQANSGGKAQPAESSNLWFSARVAHSDRLENAFSYRFYDEPRQLVIILNIGHEGLQSAQADQRDFARQLRVVMKDAENRPVALETEGTFWRFADAGRVQIHAGEPLHVVSGRGIEWELRLQRADGQRFATGPHAIELSLAGPFTALRLADGSMPRSRQSSDAVLTIRLGSPTNARERSSMHELAAQEAIQERRYADAAAAAQRAIDADPSNGHAYTVLGGAFLHLNRCPEAAAALEKVLQFGLTGRTAIPELLAQAYVCAGDEKNAKRVLRLRGIPEAQLDAEIARRARLQEAVGGGRR
jgi:tetratricopeptide (TPR) repeat protein